jgi:hypothetical protein
MDYRFKKSPASISTLLSRKWVKMTNFWTISKKIGVYLKTLTHYLMNNLLADSKVEWKNQLKMLRILT